MLDTLYGGYAGQIHEDITDKLSSNITDSKWCPNESKITEDDIIPSHQASLYALQNHDIDIRPRFYDNLSQSWHLLDTGAQVSCVPPSKDDTIDPSIKLETVDGSLMPCYGKKEISFRIGRKTYHQ